MPNGGIRNGKNRQEIMESIIGHMAGWQQEFTGFPLGTERNRVQKIKFNSQTSSQVKSVPPSLVPYPPCPPRLHVTLSCLPSTYDQLRNKKQYSWLRRVEIVNQIETIIRKNITLLNKRKVFSNIYIARWTTTLAIFDGNDFWEHVIFEQDGTQIEPDRKLRAQI